MDCVFEAGIGQLLVAPAIAITGNWPIARAQDHPHFATHSAVFMTKESNEILAAKSKVAAKYLNSAECDAAVFYEMTLPEYAVDQLSRCYFGIDGSPTRFVPKKDSVVFQGTDAQRYRVVLRMKPSHLNCGLSCFKTPKIQMNIPIESRGKIETTDLKIFHGWPEPADKRMEEDDFAAGAVEMVTTWKDNEKALIPWPMIEIKTEEDVDTFAAACGITLIPFVYICVC